MLSAKENMRRFYFEKTAEYMPEYGVGFYFQFSNGFEERPANNQGGKDWFGVEWATIEGENAPTPDTTKKPVLDEIENWREKVAFPDLDRWDWEKAVKIDAIEKVDRENNLLYVCSLNGLFERLHSLMGFENALVAMLTNPEETGTFFDAIAEFKCRQIDKLAEYYRPDILNFHDDWGTQRALFFSPELWRELIKPRMKLIVDHAHRHGMAFEMHSCGFIQDIIPEICEIGVDSLQCMSINDIETAKKITGKKMIYNVAFPVQKHQMLIARGEMNEEELRKEIRDIVMTLAKGGCYYPFYIVKDDVWTQIIHDEVGKCRQLLSKGSY